MDGYLLGGLAVAGLLAWRQRRITRLVEAGRRQLAPFAHRPELGSYTEALPRLNWPGAKAPHAVLLLHGFSAATSTFGPLYDALTEAQVPYYAPMLPGFGLDDLGPLAATRYVDWCREALNAYDLLAQTAEAVSIVGLSYGAVLASFIAERRPVRHLALVSPYFFAQEANSLPARLTVVDAWWGRALRWFVGVAAKPVLPGRVGQPDIVDGSRVSQVLHYGTLPVASVHRLWQTAHPVPLDRLQAKAITVAIGQQELTVDLPRLEAWLATQSQPIKRLVYPNSGHVLFEDQDGKAAAADLVQVLTTVPV